MDTQSISALFDSLKVDLVPIVQQILQSKTKPYTSIFKGFPVGGQRVQNIQFTFSRLRQNRWRSKLERSIDRADRTRSKLE
ncbi:MAG: hypothetical protein CMI17_09970 [Opitutaceae bacterium]|nr:hypothetical protein [Opitutaceae bacterium]